MKDKKFQNLIKDLYTTKKTLSFKKAHKYIVRIDLKLLDGKLDYALAYSLILKVLKLVEPLKSKK